MTRTFTGDPTPLGIGDYEEAATRLGCTVAAIRAVAQVESAGSGYLPDSRPKILFERHVFHRLTGGAHTAVHPDLSFPSGGGYLGGAREYDRLERAMALDEPAALASASWGKFQVMGFNHALVGEPSLDTFVDTMVSGEPGQLKYFVAFIAATGLADELQRLDWRGFARGYNGSGYERFNYHGKMARAFATFSEGGARTETPMPLLKIGDREPSVTHLQELLGLVTDGDFGPATKSGLIEFQSAKGLYADGVVGQQTWTALLGDSRTADIAGAARTRPVLREGDRGDAVKYLQGLLGVHPDGVFGAGTQVALIDFQRDHRLTPDGIVGAKTWDKLLSA
ncbi:N-acetylmuramidase domain-containing protein [Croceibacterium aestuarii]|uniref:N-acetylmuramidase domain-containing protein n=1 Tax=Croceibacterium aestuarii TaxID=3064139 RepID=UPI00272EE76A|nr:N-acetylmuramidase domain-containing protein [Croceibacterium sp. D39]